MQDKYTAFYRKNQAVTVDFSAESISSDGAVVLLEKIERKHKLIKRFSRLIPDYRNPMMTVHDNEKLLKQRCPDISLAKEILNWQPKFELEKGVKQTIEYFENLLTH